jgi:enoyl-CoA hydratase/carnithine racemase
MSIGTTYQLIRVEKQDGVGHLQLHRPERLNALSKDMLLEIGSAMATFVQDDDVCLTQARSNRRLSLSARLQRTTSASACLRASTFASTRAAINRIGSPTS